MLSESILYYPSIEFQSDSWVKSNLILWDRIYRIVPKDYTPNDSDNIKELIDNDLVRNITLNDSDVKITGDEFIGIYKNLPFVPAGLETYDDDRIHPDKIDKRLYPFLESISENFLKDGWLHLPSELARGYMFYLSKTVAARRNLVRGTDDPDCWSIAPFFTENVNFDEFAYANGAEGYYCSLYLEDLLPSNVGSLETSNLIKFVKNRADEKKSFREKLDLLNKKIELIEDKEQVYTEVTDYLVMVEREKCEFKKSMDLLSLKNAKASLFSVGIPIGLTALGAFGLGGDPFSLTKISGSISLAALGAYANYEMVKNTERDSSYLSYLLEIDKIPSNSHSNKLARNFEEFIND
jgi:hypothetical protein